MAHLNLLMVGYFIIHLNLSLYVLNVYLRNIEMEHILILFMCSKYDVIMKTLLEMSY